MSLTPSDYGLQEGFLQHCNSLLLLMKAPDLTQASALVVFALPFLVVQNLQMNKSARLSVYGVLLLGTIDIILSLARFLTIHLGNENNFRATTLIGMSFPFSFPTLQNIYLYIKPHQTLFVPPLPLTKAQRHRTVDGSRSKRWSYHDLPPLPATLHSSQQKVNKAPLM